MIRWILFFLLSINTFALEISFTGAKEDFQDYSTLHLTDSNPFLCQEILDDFNEITQVVCAFNKQPAGKIKDLQNSFFKIESKIQKKTFFLIITPYQKLKLFPLIFNMTKEKSVFQAKVKLAKHWMLLAYKEKMPYIKTEKKMTTRINFPFVLSKDTMPYVGGLDIKGNPVHIKRVGDVTDYLKIKKLYKNEKYDICLELIDEVREDYPNSLFNAELIYYKIRTYAKLKDNDNVIELSKEYLREYSSDENVPEILALVAKSYSVIGLNTDADYFFDRLFTEHEESQYTYWGYIYKGQMIDASGDALKALDFYKRALNETSNIDVAVTAAYLLASYNISYADKKEASKYIMSIVKAKSEFFMDDLVTSLDMMYQFADEQEYITASEIAKAILDITTKSHDEYENLLKDRALWLAKSADKQKALVALNDYIKEFKYGTFQDEIAIAKDELFFETNDANFTTKLNEYNNLIDIYQDDTIGNKAIYEKAKLLKEHKFYRDILAFEESILELDEEIYTDTHEIIKDSAIGVMKLALENNECQEVLNISNDYNITLSYDWDDGVYTCSMKGGDYQLSKKIAQRNLKSKDLQERKKWLYRYIQVDFATGNYSDVIGASKDLIILIKDDKNSKYKDVYRILFDTYQRLENKDKLLESIIEIESIFGTTYKDIERYVAIMNIGQENKDDNIVVQYGQKIVKIQNDSSSYAQSPFVEFMLYQAYLNIENFNSALKIIKSLDSVELDKEIRARQKYLLGTVLSKLWRDEEARVAYEEAIEADKDSPWAKLATSAKDI
ncbi:MAG: flagellar protein [Epsilonproteobacteria bacterium]|nr:MAG: flagellar protein [Campylobacterota bacterium]